MRNKPGKCSGAPGKFTSEPARSASCATSGPSLVETLSRVGRRSAVWGAFPALVALSCSKQAESSTPTPALNTIEVNPGSLLERPERVALELKENSPAPDVTLTLQDGFQLLLSSLKGKLILLYFCSADARPECVTEAHALRDHWMELHEGHHVVVFGVSRQDAASHRAFIAEHKLQFDFATDTDGNVARAFKLPQRGEYGPIAFLVSKEGTIAKSWPTVNPGDQTREILTIANE